MALANIILEFLKALIWPALLGYVLWRFRSAIERLVERIVAESEEVEAFGFKTKLRGASPKEHAVNVEKEVKTLDSATAGVGPQTAGARTTKLSALDSREQYLVAEELVLRALEARWASEIARHRVVELPNGRRLEFDGVQNSPKQVIVVEVKLLYRPVVPGEVFINISEDLIALRQHVGKSVIGFVALVAPEESEDYENLRSEISRLTASPPTPIIAELFYLPELMTQFLGTSA